VARLVSKRQSARPETEDPPARRWQLQTAKAQFSELFRRARSEGPQWVTRQDKEAVVVLPAEEFERLRARSRQPQSLVEFFAKSPLVKVKIDLERRSDYGRTIEL
jgi:prevent-host-death family protein